MLIQGVDGVELVVANIALPVGAVECMMASRVFDVLLIVVPFNLLASDDAVRVTLAHHAEDRVAVQFRGARAGTHLEVVDEAAGGGVLDLAEGAGDVGAAVDI